MSGSYTVSWQSPLDCVQDGYFGYCYYLEEKAGNGSWTTLLGGHNETSWNASGKANGIYQYEIYKSWGFGDKTVVAGPVAVQAGKPTLPPSEQEAYAVRSGDLDGDGDVDIYLKRVAGTAWTLPLPEFVLRHNSDGTFTVETTISDTERNTIASWAVSSIVPKLVDLNADGIDDLLLTGLSPAGAGPYDLVVFASNAPGAPPLKTRLLDDTVKQFAMDIQSYLNDTSYFQSAYIYECTVYWLPYTIPLWDIDGSYQDYSVFVPFEDCEEVASSAYNQTAVAIAPSLNAVLHAGQLTAGTTGATTVADGFSQIFGVPFMGGVLDGGPKILADYFHRDEDLDSSRDSLLVGALWDLLLYENGVDTPSDTHHYEVDSRICTLGTTGCTLSNVYYRMRQFPAPGHSPDTCGTAKPISLCDVPISEQDLIHVQALDIASVGAGGDVRVTLDAANYSLTNVTQPGHVFYPGTVTRQAYEKDGAIWIHTVGDGSGEYAKMNEAMGPAIFKAVDEAIVARIYLERFGIQWP